MGYVDGMTLYEFVRSSPSRSVDPTGACSFNAQADVAVSLERYRQLTWDDFIDGPGTPDEIATIVVVVDGIAFTPAYEQSTKDNTGKWASMVSIRSARVSAATYMGLNTVDRKLLAALAPDDQAFLLMHEQGHFKIAQNLADYAAERISRLPAREITGRSEGELKEKAEASLRKDMNPIIADANSKLVIASYQYDLETDHGRDVMSQWDWSTLLGLI